MNVELVVEGGACLERVSPSTGGWEIVPLTDAVIFR